MYKNTNYMNTRAWGLEAVRYTGHWTFTGKYTPQFWIASSFEIQSRVAEIDLEYIIMISPSKLPISYNKSTIIILA